MNIYQHSSWAIHDAYLQITLEVSSLTDWCQSVNLNPNDLINNNHPRYHAWQWRSYNG